ncbi:MAG TPA: DUF4136 domain-containing protein [Candidatus Acidoferrum sp.]|jgi:hypothetical protein|nr:DUF4136 domain-containing protein [Candidatus Acidoferrum sp.]
MKQIPCLVLTSVLVLLLPACSTTPKVQTQANPGADYTRYHTFALLPLPTTGPASDPGLMLRVAGPARQAAVEALAAKGLTEADRAQADLAINLRGQSLPKVEVTDWGYRAVPVYGRWGRYYGSVGYRSVDVRTVEERTLSIEIFDNRTKELAWVGWSTSQTSGPIKLEKLQQAIRNILAKFPPTPAAPPAKP